MRFSVNTLPKSDKATEQLVKELDKALDRTRASSENDPFSNSVLLSALAISRKMGDGSLSEQALAKLCNRLCIRAAAMRIDHHCNYLEELDIQTNLKRIEKLFGNDFAKFKKTVSSPFWGLVFTAHPTFALSKEALVALEDLTERHHKPALLQKLAAAPRTEKPTLDEEHQLSLRAIQNARSAHRMLLEQMFSWARKKWGAKADSLSPKFMTLATWVGYDMDGRSDITWRQTFHKRMVVASEQLEYYQNQLAKLQLFQAVPKTASEITHTPKATPEVTAIQNLTNQIGATVATLKQEQAVFSDEATPLAQTCVQMFASLKQMKPPTDFASPTQPTKTLKRITDPDQIIKPLERLLASSQAAANSKGKSTKLSTQKADEIRILLSELKTFGIGVARTHVRLNAHQLHNALIEDLKIDASEELSASINPLEKLLARTTATHINFGDLETERTSAKRLVMIVRQMLKYIDSKTPIRILIAECESHADLLAALYLAKLFGVEKKVDICPLFETPTALAMGHRIIAAALKNPTYRAYIKNRKVLAVETGWSDAGRHIGQCAAALAIENLHMNLARVLKAQKLNFAKVIIFDTHGESIGRGGHPKTLADRFRYLVSPYSRGLFAKLRLKTKRELSFQGGDGYSWFMNQNSALATICRGLEYFMAPPLKLPFSPQHQDAFYEEAEYGAEFTDCIKNFNKNVMSQNGYAALLATFGTRLAGASGSRPELRQTDAPPIYEKVANMRAIPQNAVLQQMGYMANSLGGLGTVHQQNPAKAESMEKTSPRFRRLIDIPRYGLAFSDIEIFTAYAATIDPGMWLARAARSSAPKRSAAMRKIYRLMEDWGMWHKIAPTVRIFRRDYDEVRSWLLHGKGVSVVGGGRVIPKIIRDELLLIHALRIALMHEIFVLAANLPEFSYQFGHSYEDLMHRIIRLDCDGAGEVLRKIFPPTSTHQNQNYGEPSSYKKGKTDYGRIHSQIVDPIIHKASQIRLLGQAVVNFIGAYG